MLLSAQIRVRCKFRSNICYAINNCINHIVISENQSSLEQEKEGGTKDIFKGLKQKTCSGSVSIFHYNSFIHVFEIAWHEF